MPSREGNIIDRPTDEGFHAPILGEDVLPPPVVRDLKALAEDLGIDWRTVRGGKDAR